MPPLDVDPAELERELADLVAEFELDPLGFVETQFSWGKGELADQRGPREWQRAVLEDIGRHLQSGARLEEVLRIATASGHGIGKSALVAWVILWAMSTREDTRGVVTANTEGQLRTKTWPELAKWHRNCTVRHWFNLTATAIYSTDTEHEKTWRFDATPWSETNTEAFAGLHNQGKRIVLIMDEASAIPEKIYEVAQGALTDANTEMIWLLFGNPTLNTGFFRECFGRMRHRWLTRQIDSRTVEGTNRKEAERLVEDYGADSDIVRVRVLGQFPRAGVLQFIGGDLIEGAQARQLDFDDPGAPLIMGVDIARFGDDETVVRFRQGRNGRVYPPVKWRNQDTVFSAGKIADLIMRTQPDAVFIDGGGVGGGVVDQLKAGNYRVTEINFGAVASEPLRYFDKRAQMWSELKEWLATGAVDSDQKLKDDCIGPMYGYDKDMRVQLESKKDMKRRRLASPDDGDALALTFAGPVQRRDMRTARSARQSRAVTDYQILG